MLQVDDKGIAAVFRISMVHHFPAKPSLGFDLNRDGSIDQREGAIMASTRVAELRSAVNLAIDGVPQHLVPGLARLEDLAEQSPFVVVSGFASLSPLPPEVPFQLAVRLDKGFRAGCAVQVQSLGGWRITSTSRGKLSTDGHGVEGAVELGGGVREIIISVAKVAATPDGG